MITPCLRNLRLVRSHSFLVEPEDSPLFTIDAGADESEFANILVTQFSSNVLALEPNKT